MRRPKMGPVIDREPVVHVARLARLVLSDEEGDRMVRFRDLPRRR